MKRKQNPFEIRISSFFFLASLGVKKCQLRKSLELSKFSTISRWAVSAKTGLPAGNGAQDLPEALSPPVAQPCSTPEAHMTLGPLPGPALWA